MGLKIIGFLILREMREDGFVFFSRLERTLLFIVLEWWFRKSL